MIRHSRLAPALVLAVVPLAVGCGKDKPKTVYRSPAPVVQKKDGDKTVKERKDAPAKVDDTSTAAPAVATDQTAAKAPAAPTPFLSEFRFDGVHCVKGALTPLATFENALVSPAGVITHARLPNLNPTGDDTIVLRRSHAWTFGKTAAVRRTSFVVNAGDKQARFSIDKNFNVYDLGAGRIRLVHGLLERPAVNDVNVGPALDLLALLSADVEAKLGAVSSLQAVANWLAEAKKWLVSNASSEFVRVVTNTLQEISEADESVAWKFQGEAMLLSDTRLKVSALPGLTDLRVYDAAVCGLGGEAVRTFTRTRVAE